jgi:hypothetical protein
MKKRIIAQNAENNIAIDMFSDEAGEHGSALPQYLAATGAY